METIVMKKTRTSGHGFYCNDCNKFVYIGYDRDDSKNITIAICVECGTNDPELKIALLHEYDSTRGLWCIDRDPKEVDIDWIRKQAFQLT